MHFYKNCLGLLFNLTLNNQTVLFICKIKKTVRFCRTPNSTPGYFSKLGVSLGSNNCLYKLLFYNGMNKF